MNFALPLRFTQVVPLDIRSQFFARHPSAHNPLDGRAVFGGNPIPEPALDNLVPDSKAATEIVET
jgi:hypothetical protein